MTDAYLLVTGGRDFADEDTAMFWLRILDSWLDTWHDGVVPTLVNGDARGADRLTATLAEVEMGWAIERHPADWDTLGRRAGVVRNQHMLDAHRYFACLAFPGGRGTADMVNRCHKAGVPVVGPEHGLEALTTPSAAVSP